MTSAEITSITISVLTLITTVIIFIIQFMQNKNVNKRLEKRRKEELRNNAKRFIIDNDEEIEYLPFAVVGLAYNSHHKYKRAIYNNFNRLSIEEQMLVLEELKYENKLIIGNDWIDNGLEDIKKFINENKLGKDMLHDGGKYFKRSMNYSELKYDVSKETSPFYSNLFGLYNLEIFGNGVKYKSINMIDYFFEYYRRIVIRKDPLYILNKNVIAPMDLLYSIKNLGSTNESEVCFWIMNAVQIVSLIMKGDKNPNPKFSITPGDAKIETYEDKFLSVLMDIYNYESLNK